MFDFLFGKPKNVSSASGDVLSGVWFSNIISGLTDAIIAYDGDFKILIFNKSAEQIFGLTAKEILGQTVSLERAAEPRLKILAQVMFPSLAPNVTELTEPGAYPQIADLRLENSQLRATTNKIVDASGAVLGFVKIIRDRSREAEILRSKSEFLTVAAHQLRTPLTAVEWAFEGLKKDSAIAPESRELIETGSGAAKKLLQIVDDLLQVAKLEGGKFGYSFREGDLAQFLDQILARAEPVAKAYGVSLFFQKPEKPLPPITFDAEKLGLAISNLLENAVKYNVPNGSVTLAVRQLSEGPYLQVSVRDTGVGIPPEAMDKLFTKFFRAENVMRFSTEGSGLGLYLVKNIVERHGGKIWADSELNRGTTFYFTLPTDPALIPQKEMVGEGD